MTDPHRERARRDLGLASQLVGLETNVYHGACGDVAADNFVASLRRDGVEDDVQQALRKLALHGAARRLDGVGYVHVINRQNPPLTTRELAILVAQFSGWDRQQATVAATRVLNPKDDAR